MIRQQSVVFFYAGTPNENEINRILNEKIEEINAEGKRVVNITPSYFTGLGGTNEPSFTLLCETL